MGSRLDKLRSKKTHVTISEIDLELKSLSFPELTELSKYMDTKDTKGALQYLLYTALRNAVPVEEYSDEELNEFIEDMDSKYALEIVNKVQELSGLSTPKND